MSVDVKQIPGVPEETQRALSEVQTSIARECERIEQSARRPRRRVTEVVESGSVIAKPGEVVRVLPGDEDVTVVLPEPTPATDGEDIVISFEGDGAAAGRVIVQPAAGTCGLPGTQTLNAPGSYRFTSVGGGQTAKPRAPYIPNDPTLPAPAVWSGPPPVTVDDLPPIATDSLVDNSVDNAILDDMPGHSVKVNAGSSTGDPTDLVLNTLSVLGRAGLAGTGDVQSIDVPDTSQFTGESVFLRSSSTRTALQFRSFTFVDLPMIADNSFIGNIIGTTSRPYRANFSDLDSNSIVYVNGTKEFVREALTGDITAAQNVNVTAFRGFVGLSVLGQAANFTAVPTEITATPGSGAVLRESGSTIGWGTIATAGLADNSVTDAKLRDSAALSVIGRSPNSTGDPADIVATAGSGGVLRESGNALTFGTIATAGLADDSVTNAKLANMAARTVKGRADAAGTGDPQDLTGAQVGSIIRWNGSVGDTTSSGALTSYALASGTNILTFNGVTATLHGIQAAAEVGQFLWIRHIGAGAVSLVQESSSAGAATERLAMGDGFTANSTAMILGNAGGTFNRSVLFMYTGSRWQRMDDALAELSIVTQLLAQNAVTDAKLRDSAACSVIGRSANSSGDPADIAAANDGEVLRRSGTALGFGTVATAGIADDAVTDAKLANMAERRLKGRADGAGTGDPQALTGAQAGAIIRWGNQVPDSTTTGSVPTLTLASSTNLYTFNSVSPVLHGMSVPAEIGQVVAVQHIGSGSTSVVHESSTAGATGQRFRLGPFASNTTALVIRQGQTALFMYDNRWLWIGGAGALVDGDKGDITVSSQGATWTIDNDVVTDAKLRDSAACSVIGRSANSSGDPADIAATVNDRVLVRRSNVLTWTTIVDGDITAGTITLGKLVGLNPNTLVGNNTGSATNPVEISVGTNCVVGRVAGNIVAAQLATAQCADNAITDAKIRQSAALSVVGRSPNSTGNVADIATTAGSGAVLRESGSALSFGTVATAGIADGAVTLAKQANLAESRIIGRAEGAGTGVPTALTPTQVAAIIDGETFTWTAAHNFSGVLTTLDTALISSQLRLTGIISATLSGDVDDWAPTGLPGAHVIRVTASGANRTINSISGGADGRLLIIINVSSNLVIIANNGGSGSSSNKIIHNMDAPFLAENETMTLWYDGTSSRWRVIACAGSFNP